MRRLGILGFFVALLVIGAGASGVLAGSSKKTATYWNNTVPASTFQASVLAVARPYQPAGTWHWLSYGKKATWTFDVGAIPALNGSLALNFSALSTSIQMGGGAGFDTNMSVVVTGLGTATLTGMLNNPWQPHVGYNDSPPTGWQGYASLVVPTGVWKGASTLVVTVTPTSTNTLMGVNKDSLMLGYASVGS